MRFLVLFVLLGSLMGGCARAPQTPVRMNVAGTIISIPRNEFDAIVQEAVKKHKLVFRWYEFRDENTLLLYLSDTPNRPAGAVVVYRKIDGKWQETSFEENGWIA